jgi:hypothetical protein
MLLDSTAADLRWFGDGVKDLLLGCWLSKGERFCDRF